MFRLRRASHRKNVTAPIVVDFQCFKDNYNEFILKEVCALEADSGTLLMHHIAKPPFKQDILKEEKQRESYWLTKHYHGLEWNQGDIWYYLLEEKLRTCISKRATVYVKGAEKKDFIRRHFVTDFCTTQVIDLNDIGCGSLSSINNLMSKNLLRCHHHKTLHSRCALSNCIALRGWLFLSAAIDDDDNGYDDNSDCSCSCFQTSTTTSSTSVNVGIDTVE